MLKKILLVLALAASPLALTGTAHAENSPVVQQVEDASSWGIVTLHSEVPCPPTVNCSTSWS